MKNAFTLAEVLIVIGILGLVADMTIPTLITNVNERALTTAKKLAALKFEEVMAQMSVNDKLVGYNTADDFVNEFKQYIKIMNRCPSTAIEGCFTPKINTADKVVNSKNLKNGADIVIEEKASNYPSANVGITLPNGTMAIVNYDKTCAWKSPLEGGGANRKQALLCLAMVYDVNGLKKPNKVGEDIILLNAKLTDCDGVRVGSMCVDTGDVTIVPLYTCSGPDAIWDTSGSLNEFCANDMFAGANKACDQKKMRLPTFNEVGEMAKFTYGLNSAPDINDSLTGLTVKNDSLNLVGSWVWSNQHANVNKIHVRSFETNSSFYSSPNKNTSGGIVRCVK